jgi:hypothetical protein
MDMAGYFGGEPRLPLKKLNENQFNQLRNLFVSSGFLDL